ncbi:MAG: helix-turn-helix domain-containing protein [Coriobacteriia bacterium]
MTNQAERLGARIRTLRERLGLSQENLAKRVGFSSRQTLSELEHGRREVKAGELFAIARALRVDVMALLSEIEPARPSVLWRARPAANAEELQAAFLTWCERYSHVLTATGSAHSRRSPLPAADIDPYAFDFSDAEELAIDVARMLDTGARPAGSLQKALEVQFDIIIWYLDLGADGSAACTKGTFGSAMLINRREAPWRRNFDMAHELFHLLTWDSMTPVIKADTKLAQRAERLANAFAAALLLPADEVKNELEANRSSESLSRADLVAIARDFGVSSEALLWRLLNLGLGFEREQIERLLRDPDFRALDKASQIGQWWDPPPLPERFVRLAHLASTRGRLSRSKLAGYLECGLPDLSSCLGRYGIAEESEGEGITFTLPSETAFELEVSDGEAEVCFT